jgi:hypothetical protein
MKTKRVHARRGDRYDALAKGYKILKSPLADSFSAAAEHFNETDPPIDGGVKTESKAKSPPTF